MRDEKAGSDMSSDFRSRINVGNRKHRPISAPPVDKFFIGDDIEFEDIHTDLGHSVFHRRCYKDESRLRSSNFPLKGQDGCFQSWCDDLISKAFSNVDSLVGTSKEGFLFDEGGMSLTERIDEDYPESEKSSEYKGASRTTTPIGDANVLDVGALSAMMNFKGGKESIDVTHEVFKEFSEHGETSEITGGHMFMKDLLEQRFEISGECEWMHSNEMFLKDLCVSMSKDQEKSRYIQKRMDVVSQEEISWFFDCILDSVFDLSSNLFSNYVVQKIIPLLKDEERSRLSSQLSGKIHSLSMHPYGCRVIQRLIDTSCDLDFILKEVDDHLLELIEDQNGNHVVQKCIEKCANRGTMLAQFLKNPLFLATHKYGCRVIQRMLEFCGENEVGMIVDVLVGNIEALVNDQYGNYVIQHILTVSGEQGKNLVVEKIIEGSYELSKHKFSSNVVEQCVKNSSDDQKWRFVEKFLEPSGSRPKMFFMCVDMYGNYVVQRLYNSSEEKIRVEMKEALKPFIKDLKKSPFAKHILFKICP